MALGKSPIEIVNEGKHPLLTKAKHWKRIFLKEIAKVQNGYAFSSNSFVKLGGIPLIRIRDIDKHTTVDRFDGSYPVEFIVNTGDILIGMDGDFKAAYWKGGKALLNQRVCRIINFSDVFDRKFLFLCLQPFLNAINEETSSVTVKHLSSKTIQDIPLPFPPLKTQQAIVSKIEELFSELDKGIAELKLAQEQLKVYRQSVLKYAFESTNKKLIGELYDFIGGGTPSKKEKKFWDGNLNWSSVKDVKGEYLNDTIDYISEEGLLKSASNVAMPSDVILITRISPGKTIISNIRTAINQDLKIIKPKFKSLPKFIFYSFKSIERDCLLKSSGTTVKGINLINLKEIIIPAANIDEQHKIVEEIESRLSVADKMEESIAESLQKAEALRQSILKKAFSGELIKEVKAVEVPKIKNEYFHQLQLVALVINGFKKEKIDHGEMTLAKNLYLLDSIYKIPTGFKYDRWHLGPYPPALKKVVNNKEYFKRNELFIETTNDDKLQKYNNPYQDEVNNAINDLSAILSKYKGAERSHKTELLATVCKVIEDVKSTDLVSVRQSMAEWKIDLKTSKFKNKAEKFNEPETKKCIEFIVERGWDRKLI